MNITGMNIFNKNINWYRLVFIIFVTAYALLMLVKPNLGGTQDDFMLIRTIQSGRPILYYSSGFPYGNQANFGRFSFLAGMEYNFFGFFSKSPSAFWYFLFHAFQYVLFAVLFVKILSKFTSNKFLIYLTPILLSLTPAVTIPFFRTHLNERNAIFYYAIFLFCYLLYLEKPKLRYLVLGVINANIAIHYKETGFIALAAFAFFHLLLSWKKSKLGVKIFDGLVLLGSFVYLLLYYLIIYLNLPQNSSLYGQTPFAAILVLTKNFLNYAFFSDPILILILLPFTAWRIYKAWRRQLELHPVYDSMLLAGSMYVLAFFVLRKFGIYYLLPAYIFALPPLIYFFSRREQRTLLWKGAAAVCGLAFLLNVFPAGIHYLTYYKYTPINFNKTLDFLINDINSRYPRKRANIFFDAIDSRGGGGVYFLFAEFLQHKGLSWERFDFRSNVKMEDNFLLNINFDPPFAVFQNKFYEISKGDYLIVSPWASKTNITKAHIQSLTGDYDLVFQTKSPLAFPSFDLKTLVKYIMSKRLAQNQREKGLMLNENLMNWPDYYVFIRK